MRPIPVLRGVRYISISQLPSVTIPSTVDLADAVQNVQEIQPSLADGEEPQFQTLGAPPVLLSLNLPPKAPVFIKKGSLLLVYGLHNQRGTNTTTPLSLAGITKQLEIISPVKRTILGGFSFTYEKLSSSEPFSLIVSANNKSMLNPFHKSNGNKTFATLTLDGRIDWAVFPNDAVQLYSGESLLISNNVVPKAASTTLLQKLSTREPTATGLFSWFKAGYTLLSGRGYVGLVGNGQIYRIQLRASEEIMVAKKSLLAVSISGHNDLANCVIQQSLSNYTSEKLAEIEKKQALAAEEATIMVSADEAMPPSAVSKVSGVVKRGLAGLKQFVSFSRTETANFISGSSDYVKIVGPRTILFQTSQHKDGSFSSRSFHNKVSVTEQVMASQSLKLTQQASKPQPVTQDFLSYATVRDGKVEFQSTKDFSKTVQEIEARAKA
ncbi:hypothetical protein BABINDRAFT_32074 [Babjeviella inositovora NRRL Y-12698]|uniref:Altered inheritance of mitochondria protein 24, mitochondrial n=1 Tax=Babjeviella inositovora NRRL Y-12698 TaxID=984486 RepID=A0A1E3QVY1_9ASCO|nr:uncharacterized protein BABINDRAFT_32074 [Babjeviella inositovora NRRL Y-12698]ODQ81819.1 hypothetical protein BABINDRAFT_32074 [Babjeviella inositovora NRRL Y-12698]